jgi:alkylated DNA repair dioxygenase AlkB
MTHQLALFASASGAAQPEPQQPNLPAGFRYQPELIGAEEEEALLAHLRELPFREFQFHGFTGRRRVISFGWQYDFAVERLRQTDDMPEFLLPLLAVAAEFAGLEPEELPHALITEYGPGAAIGWHRDKAVFGHVVGISLLAPCVFRLRRAVPGKSTRAKWERVNVTLPPRSVYHLSGPARQEWEHSIPPVDALRYSITFRTLRDALS